MGIRTLARELHLSIGTVSRALNNRPDVNEQTRARVKEAAIRVGYVPNQSGRSLRKGRTGIVAVLIPTSGFFPTSDAGLFKVLEGTRRALHRAELDLMMLFRGPDESPLENLQRIVSRRIADAIIVTHTVARDPRLSYLQQAGVEYVAFGRSPGIDDYPWVDFDFESVAAEAVRLFVCEGHRRLALVLSEQQMNYGDILTEGFRAEARRAGLPAGAVQVLRTHDARLTAAGRAAFAAEDGPTAVLAGHENIAAALYGDLAELGLQVGVDVSLICTFPPAGRPGLAPAVSYFDTDLDAVGTALAEQLMALLPERAADRRELPPTRIPLVFAPRASHRRAELPVRA